MVEGAGRLAVELDPLRQRKKARDRIRQLSLFHKLKTRQPLSELPRPRETGEGRPHLAFNSSSIIQGSMAGQAK
jgi:hypothetical protein